MEDRKRRAIALQSKRWMGNFVRGKILNREFLLPFVGVYHITYRCNGRCSFCSRKADIDQGDSTNNGHVETILRRIKELTPTLYITGGEPTLESNIGDILLLAQQIGFWPICLNTNAILLDKHPDVPRYTDKTVVSLHAGSPEKHATVLRVSRKQGERVFDNIVHASQEAKRHGNTLSVNCVLTEDNLSDAYGVLEFCLRHEIPIAVVPAIQDHMPAIAGGNARSLRLYRDFIDEVINVKKQEPNAVVGSTEYLKHIRQLARFKCRPTGIITISPEGLIVSPCDYKYHSMPPRIGRADDTETIKSQLRHHLDFASTYEVCSGNCLKMCYLEPALILETPWLTIRDFLQ